MYRAIVAANVGRPNIIRGEVEQFALELTAAERHTVTAQKVYTLVFEEKLKDAYHLMAPLVNAAQDPNLVCFIRLVIDHLRGFVLSEATKVDVFFKTLILSLLESVLLHSGPSAAVQAMINAEVGPTNHSLIWEHLAGLKTTSPWSCAAESCKPQCWSSEMVVWYAELPDGRAVEGPHAVFNNRPDLRVKTIDARWTRDVVVAEAVRHSVGEHSQVVVVASGVAQQAIARDASHFEGLLGTSGCSPLQQGTQLRELIRAWAHESSGVENACGSAEGEVETSPQEIASTVSFGEWCTTQIETGTFMTGRATGWSLLVNDSLRSLAQSVLWREGMLQSLFATVRADDVAHLHYVKFSSAGSSRRLHVEPGGMAASLTNHNDGVRIIIVGTPKNFASLQGRDLKKLYTHLYKMFDKKSLDFADYGKRLDMRVFLLRPGETVLVHHFSWLIIS
jgi:hypothetical protein